MVSEPVEDGLHELTVELRFDTLDLLRLHQASCSAEVVDGDIFIESDVTGVASCKEATSDPSEERIDCGVVVVPAGDVTAWFGAGERTFEVPTTTTQCVRPD